MEPIVVSPVRAALVLGGSLALATVIALGAFGFFIRYIEPNPPPVASQTTAAVPFEAPDNRAIDCAPAYRHMYAINCVHSEHWITICQAAERAGVSMNLRCVEASEKCDIAKKCLGEP
jgi:hypothetical protein